MAQRLLPKSRALAGLVAGISLLGCGDNAETHRLSPELLGMTDAAPAQNAGGENAYYEVKRSVELPILRPSRSERRELRGRVGPFNRSPWVEAEDIEVQVSWTLANLDRQAHDVEILLDPWNEFGRYWPGVQIDDDEVIPNLSGIDIRRRVPGLDDPEGRSSRVEGTFTFDDMFEVAVDFATVINLMENPPGGDEITLAELVNHTFNVENRHGRTPLTDRFMTAVFPAIVGFDIGLRTTEPANIAIEIVVEIVDQGTDKIVERGATDPTLREPDQVYRLGG